MIRIGGSVGGRFSRPIMGITCYENRILQNNEHSYFWTDSKFCIDNKIFLIVNIDTYLTGGRWQPTNQQLRDFTIATKNQLKNIGANKLNCRFTFDNESDEYLAENFESYFNYVRVIHDALNGEFDLGAGNFRTARIDWYNTLASKYNQGYYEVLDIHFQDGMNDETSIMSIANKFSAIKTGFGIKRMAVTEGNNFYNVSTQRGHDLLKFQINIAENIGCEDFCFAFTNWTSNSEEGHEGLTYCVNGNPISSHWADMKNLILQKKPQEEEVEYLRPDELQAIYDEFGIQTPYRWETPNLFVVGRKDPNKTLTWADVDAMEETRMKALISGLKKIGSLPSNFPNYPNIKYNSDGSWNSNWQAFAKSGGLV
jgi:hypothetical protein